MPIPILQARSRWAPLLVLTHLAACSAGGDQNASVTIDTLPGSIPLVMSSAPIEPGRWGLMLDRELQPPRGTPEELLNPSAVAIADDGELYVVERDPLTVRRYNAEGMEVGTIGRAGEGPGEFRNAGITLNGDTLFVHDIRLMRATAFDRHSGAGLQTARTGCCFPENPVSSRDGTLLTRSGMTAGADGRRRNTVIRTDFATQSTDTAFFSQIEYDGKRQWNVGKLGQFETFASIPLVPSNIVALGPDGILTGYGAEYRLRLSKGGQDTVRLFGRQWTPTTVSVAEQAELAEQEVTSLRTAYPASDAAALRAAMPPETIPTTRPAFDRILMDDVGRTWVVAGLANPDSVLVDLFDREGRWLDQLHQPSALWRGRLAITSNRLVAIAEDAEGYPLVRVYRIERRK